MKNLEELGISPAPWKVVPYGESTNSKVATHGDVEFANGESAFMKDGGVNLQKIADTRLVAAAPELYECLREAVIGMCHDCDNYEDDGCVNTAGACYVQRWRKALAEAIEIKRKERKNV